MVVVNRANESQEKSVSMMFCAYSIFSMVVSFSTSGSFATCVNAMVRVTLSLLGGSSMVPGVLRGFLPRLGVLGVVGASCNLNVSWT